MDKERRKDMFTVLNESVVKFKVGVKMKII